MSNASKRLLTIDVGRGLAVYLLVLIHALWMYGDATAQEESTIGLLIQVLGKNTAAFMMLMGLSLAISQTKTVTAYVMRGLGLMLIGYSMNALKFLVPIQVFGNMPENFIEAYGWSSPLNTSQLIYLLLTGDILQMAGLTLVIFAFTQAFSANKYWFLLIAFLLSALSGVMRGYRIDITGFDYVLDLLWGKHFNVFFPVFPWASCIFVGVFFGRWFLELDRNESQLYWRMFLISPVAIGVGWWLCQVNPEYHYRDFFHTGPGGMLFMIGVNLPLFILIYSLIQLKPDAFWVKALQYASVRVTSFYVIQWVLVCWGMGYFGYHQLSIQQVLMTVPLLMLATLLVLMVYTKIKGLIKPYITNRIHRLSSAGDVT